MDNNRIKNQRRTAKIVILISCIFTLFSCNHLVKERLSSNEKQSLITQKQGEKLTHRTDTFISQLNDPVAKRYHSETENIFRFYELKEIDPKAVHIVNLHGLEELNGFLALASMFPYLEKLSVRAPMTNSLFEALMSKLEDKQHFKKLMIDRCSLKKISPSIAKLQHLETFCSYRNPLVAIPAEIGLMKNLRKLEFDFPRTSELKILPTEIGKLEELEVLIIIGSKIETLPMEIGNCEKLSQLTVNQAQLKKIPPEIGLCSKLKNLTLYSNKIENLPLEIGDLTELRSLSVDANQLTELPVSVKHLKKLITLSFGDNKFSVFPKEILSLNNLVGLSIDKNEFKKFPVELGDLRNLQYLSIDRHLTNKHNIEVLLTKNRKLSITLVDKINIK